MTADIMRIAITGPTGMIGSSLIDLALEQGHEIIAIARPGSHRMHNLERSDRIEVKECEISDYKSIMGGNRCDIFFHLAWDKTFGGGRDDVRAQIRNIEYTLDAVSLASSWGASAFVGAGSQAEHGKVDGKIGRYTPVNPTSGYGIAKYSAGKLSGLLCQQLGIRFCWARILSVYGERDADHTLIMYLINTLLNRGVPKLTKCEQMWDYMYSEDAAGALLSIGLLGKDGRVYTVGNGECRRLREYVNELRDTIDPALPVEFGAKEYYPHQPMMLCADTTDLTKDTGFIPKYRFADGISKTIDIIKKRSNWH
jgi:nucleoside-diphosphate-sugar epimerase